MVVLRVTMLEGRPPEKRRELVQRLTEMASRLLGEPYEEIRVILYEVRRDQWAVGGCFSQTGREGDAFGGGEEGAGGGQDPSRGPGLGSGFRGGLQDPRNPLSRAP